MADMVSEKIYYSLSEVQSITGLPATTLRYWEKHFAQLSPRKDKHGNRYYTMTDIELIKQIRYLRDELHITRIEAIRQELGQGKRQADFRQRVADILQRVRQELVDIRSFI
ncbi:MAG: MerR family transcriptional regulator [Paludibacteraceae bacterium]|nr:MerR family transcriptional regulator [Paludibacteraceae bacterium]